MFDLLCEGTDASKLAMGWREGIFLLRHGVGSRDHLIFRSGDPEVERLADRKPGLRQGNPASDSEKQAEQNAKSSFHNSSLRTKFQT
jgi:hypothetical protein